MAEEEGRLSGKEGRQGSGGQNRVAGRVRWRAGSGDWQGGEAGQVVGGDGSSEKRIFWSEHSYVEFT